MKNHSLAELKKRLAEIEKRLQKYDEDLRERNRLQTLIASWEAYFPEEAGRTKAAKGAKLPGRPTEALGDAVSTEAFAYRSLSEFGAMAPSMLLTSVRQKGWVGTGNDARDKDTLYRAMKRRPSKFVRSADGTWDVIDSAGERRKDSKEAAA